MSHAVAKSKSRMYNICIKADADAAPRKDVLRKRC